MGSAILIIEANQFGLKTSRGWGKGGVPFDWNFHLAEYYQYLLELP